MKILWETTFKNSIVGILQPTADPFSPDEFYLADGWCSMYNSMRLRKVSFVSGKEIDNVLIRNMVRCLHFSSDGKFIFGITDNKIFKFNRETLQIEEKFDKGIPKYMSFMQADDMGNFVMMNYAGKTISVFNHLENKILHKKITKKDWCCNIIKENAENYLIFSSKNGVVQRYNLPKNSLETVLETQTFHNGIKDKSGNFYFQLGQFKAGAMSTDTLRPLSQILIISEEKQQKIHHFEHYFSQIMLSQDEKSLFLIGENKIWQFSLQKEKIVNEFVSPKHTSILHFFEEKQMILAVEHQSEDKKLLGVLI
ncbi:MAG: hypothetical protein Q4A09_06440 [Capnocytophaga felis]|nr:hypothetical protein [Capnocytophaga felis]